MKQGTSIFFISPSYVLEQRPAGLVTRLGRFLFLPCKFPLKNEKEYSILYKLSHGPPVRDKAALVGESAVPCNLQSATAGMNSRPRSDLYCLTHISGDEESVPRNGIPRTMSGGEPSSIKWIFSCAAGFTASELAVWVPGIDSCSTAGVRSCHGTEVIL